MVQTRKDSLRGQTPEIKRNRFAHFAATQARVACVFAELLEISRARRGHGACSPIGVCAAPTRKQED
jgi:hypothetical protein